jgi:hypothetical protein
MTRPGSQPAHDLQRSGAAIDALSEAVGVEPGLGGFQLPQFAQIARALRIAKIDDLICHRRIPAVPVPARKRAGGFVARARRVRTNFVGQCQATTFALPVGRCTRMPPICPPFGLPD